MHADCSTFREKCTNNLKTVTDINTSKVERHTDTDSRDLRILIRKRPGKQEMPLSQSLHCARRRGNPVEQNHSSSHLEFVTALTLLLGADPLCDEKFVQLDSAQLGDI